MASLQTTPEVEQPSRVRYKVLAFTVCLAAITYLDRVCISITARDIMRELALTKLEMSFVFSAFTLAYALFEIPTGWWGDRVGTRKVLTRIVAWWSTFTIATAAAFSYFSLLLIRFLFGVGEAGAFPNAAKTVSRWFPVTERGTAQGIFFMGAHLSGGLTPILVTAMLTCMPWRAIFMIFGLIGFVWATAWYRWFRDDPALHRSVGRRELDLIQDGRIAEAGHHFAKVPWGRLLKKPSLIALCIFYFTQSYGFYFYITWLPTYLEKVLGFSSLRLGVFSGLPLILSVAGDLGGGLVTDRLTRKYGLRVGRCWVAGTACVASACFMISGTAMRNPIVSAWLIALSLATVCLTLGPAWSTCIDIGGRHAGVVSACMNTSGQIGGVLSPIVLAAMVQRFAKWNAPLYLSGALYLIGAASWVFVDPGKPLLSEV